MYGDVNISAILDSFSGSYDKRVRPNYGGEFLIRLLNNIFYFITAITITERKFTSIQ